MNLSVFSDLQSCTASAHSIGDSCNCFILPNYPFMQMVFKMQ